MKVCLKTHAKRKGLQTAVIHVHERKPAHVVSPCELTCTFQIEACQDYYLLTLDVRGTLEIVCQRCLDHFQQNYTNQTRLAVCVNDDISETLMASYECIVAKDYQVDLTDVVTDELHLFLPEKHSVSDECDVETGRLIANL
jgi:uncharacterized protein